jgi:hypothetical protein
MRADWHRYFMANDAVSNGSVMKPIISKGIVDRGNQERIASCVSAPLHLFNGNPQQSSGVFAFASPGRS